METEEDRDRRMAIESYLFLDGILNKPLNEQYEFYIMLGNPHSQIEFNNWKIETMNTRDELLGHLRNMPARVGTGRKRKLKRKNNKRK